MTRVASIVPAIETAKLIRAWVEKVLADFEEGAPYPAILLAIMESQSSGETCHLGRALLEKLHVNADAPFRVGGALCDPQIEAIAGRLGWSA